MFSFQQAGILLPWADIGCGFNRSMQHIVQIVELAFGSVTSSWDAHSTF
jgi:hypothetical protein